MKLLGRVLPVHVHNKYKGCIFDNMYFIFQVFILGGKLETCFVLQVLSLFLYVHVCLGLQCNLILGSKCVCVCECMRVCVCDFVSGVIWCASIEVRVGKSDWPQGQSYVTLVPMQSLMSAIDARLSRNTMRTCMFSKGMFITLNIM